MKVNRTAYYRLFDLAAAAALGALVLIVALNLVGRHIVSAGGAALHTGSNSIIVDRNGQLAAVLVDPQHGFREEAKLSEMPKLLLDAFVATEDRRFYAHGGLDWIGIARSLRNNLLGGGLYEGGSTITQQLARTLYLSNEKSLNRKMTEIAIATALEKQLSKEQVLVHYLNHIYFGRQQVGIKAAASRYFGIDDLHQLQLWQIATLAGIPKAPNRFNPVDDYAKSKERRKVVLALMQEQGLITEQQRLEAEAANYVPPKEVKRTQGGDRFAAYTAYVLSEAMERTGLSQDELMTGGYTIETGLNPDLQQHAEAVFADNHNFPAADKKGAVQGGAAVIEHRSGEITALVGGRHYKAGQFNRAFQITRQPGSAFKPLIVYGPALESGKYRPGTFLQDKLAAYNGYQPQNGSGVYRGSVTMSEAVRQSINAPAVWLLDQIGLPTAMKFAGGLGISFADEDRNLSLALGGMYKGVSPLAMAQAYSAFAAGGKLHEAHAIRSIKDAGGRTIYKYAAQGKQVMTKATSAAMTAMLRDVVERGTGKQAKINGRAVAGKTGTTQAAIKGVPKKANRDLWFAGYTADQTAAVWLGLDQTDRDHYLTASSGSAARVFAALLQ
ncbi:transglycosylase domain-containing protein [Paenibacillus sp. GCM10027626]|uniref:transglycosylase domain-containing protein n=1 Tax=Paenibacillus sp. GCM10027626 TaxID=3273411 RepID=UPI003642BFAD